MKIFLNCFFICLLALCGVGCSVFSRQVREFDLVVEPLKKTGVVRVAAVRNLSNSGQSMLQRSGSQITRDPLNIWTAEPGSLICNALNQALDKDGTNSAKLVFCDVDRFEADMKKRTFHLSGTYYYARGQKNKFRFDLTSPLKSDSPQHIAEAASSSVRQLAVRLSGNEIK